jgi:hypothetical protein
MTPDKGTRCYLLIAHISATIPARERLPYHAELHRQISELAPADEPCLARFDIGRPYGAANIEKIGI